MITLNNSNIDFGFEDESLGSKYSISLSQNTSNFIFKTDGIERMTIMKNGNIGFGTTNANYNLDVKGSINADSYLINNVDISIITSDTSNYIGITSNILVGRINDTSNYIATISNILVGSISDTSNYVRTTSNIFVNATSDTSNYIKTTSNILVSKANINDSNSSNYIVSTSNILLGRIRDTSNYIRDTSNLLVSSISYIDTSNYVKTTNNYLVDFINLSKINKWITVNDMIYYNTSNVGIGTNNPVSKLHLYDEVSNVTSLTIQTSNFVNYQITSFPEPERGTFQSYMYMIFKYTTTTQGFTGQTEYILTTPNIDLIADILVVGGGGSGAGNEYGSGGGGGGGGIVYMVNKTLNRNTTYKVYVGDGGITVGTSASNGKESSIKLNNNSYLSYDNKNVRGIGGGGGALNGGSGGGAALYGNTIGNGNQGNTFWDGSTYLQAGFNGALLSTYDEISHDGLDLVTFYYQGGGGGAGGNGNKRDGGTGRAVYIISDTATNYGGGGGGGTVEFYDDAGFSRVWVKSGTGGIGGGGDINSIPLGDGTPHTGGGGYFLSGRGGSGIVIIKYKSELSTSSLIKLKNFTTDYNILNDKDDFKITSTVSSQTKNILVIKPTGFVGIGTTNPGYMLDVFDDTTIVPVSFRNGGYFFKNTNSGTYTASPYTPSSRITAKFNDSILITDTYYLSSDIRIKEDIQDINNDSVLQSILAVELKKYKYIDKINKGNGNVYGFIAQQVKNVIPEAVNIEKSYIPNIMLVADYNNKIIILPHKPTKVTIKIKDKIKCYNDDNKFIEIEVSDIINEVSFKIKDLDKEYTCNKIFVYGTYVDDFHTLFKEHIFTLNVGATQELYRQIKKQQDIIKSQEEHMDVLEQKNAVLNQNFENLLKEIDLINKQFD